MFERTLLVAGLLALPAQSFADTIYRGGYEAKNPSIVEACLAVKDASNDNLCQRTGTRHKNVTPCDCHKSDELWTCTSHYQSQCKDNDPHALFDTAWMSTGTAAGYSSHSRSLACRGALQKAHVAACPSNTLTRTLDGCACIHENDRYVCLVDYKLYCHSPYVVPPRPHLAAAQWIKAIE